MNKLLIYIAFNCVVFAATSSADTINVASGETIVLTSQTTIDGPSGVVPSGTLINESLLFNESSLTNEGGFNNDGSLSNNSELTNNGFFSSKGRFYNSGTFSNNSRFVSDNTIENTGQIANNGTFNNNSRMDQLGGIINNSNFVNDGLINNQGGINNSGSFTNNGFVSSEGSLRNSGAFNLQAGSILDGSARFFQSGGSLTVDGELWQNFVSIRGGTVGGNGTIGIFEPNSGNVEVSDASIRPGHSPGILTIDGDLSVNGTSTLALELGGTIAGIGYDRLDVLGNVSLAAGMVFDIDFYAGFFASDGDFFDVLVGDSFEFSDLSSFLFDTSDARGINWKMSIFALGDGRQSVRLTASVPIPEVPLPASLTFLLAGLGGLCIACGRRRS